MAKDEVGGVKWELAGQVRQLLAERANAETYGQTTRIAAVDKQLAELGYVRDEGTPEVSRSSAPVGRHTSQDRAEHTAEVKVDKHPGRREQGKSTT